MSSNLEGIGGPLPEAKEFPAGEIKLKAGRIQLPNGHEFEIKIKNGEGGLFEGLDQIDLTEQIIKLLNESQDGFKYKDLSNTKITSKGIETDQKSIAESKEITMIKPEDYPQKFTAISKLAAKAIEQKREPVTLPPGVDFTVSAVEEPKEPAAIENELAEEVEAKSLKSKALETLQKIREFFRPAGENIKKAWAATSEKASSLYHRMVLAVEKAEVDQAEAKKEISWDWKKVSLEEIDKVMAEVVEKKGKVAIDENGKLCCGKREFGILDDQVGKNPKTQKVMTDILKKIQSELTNSTAFVVLAQHPSPGQTPSPQKADEYLDQLEIAERILKALEDSEWAKLVISNNDLVGEKVLLSKSIQKATEGLKNIESLKYLDEKTKFKFLFDQDEKNFRREYLTNYRVYHGTTENFLDVLKKQYDDGNKEGVLLVLKEWLEDPFINNNEHLTDKGGKVKEDIYGLIGFWETDAILYDIESTIINENTIAEMKKMLDGSEDAKVLPSVKPGSLQAKEPFSSEGYQGYTNMVKKIADRTISKEERERLIEDMSSDLYKINTYYLAQINSSEFVNQAWSKDNKETNAPNLVKLTQTFNDLSTFIQYNILMRTMHGGEDNLLENRAKMLEFFIDLADRCLEKGDLMAMNAIVGGLRTSAMNRLKDTWGKVDDEHMRKLEQLAELANPERRYKNHNQKVEALKTEDAIFIPYIGVSQTLYTFTEEGKKTYNESKELNREKLALFDNALAQIRDPQLRIAEAAKNGVINFNLKNDLQGEIESIRKKCGKTTKEIDDFLFQKTFLIQPRK